MLNLNDSLVHFRCLRIFVQLNKRYRVCDRKVFIKGKISFRFSNIGIDLEISEMNGIDSLRSN